MSLLEQNELLLAVLTILPDCTVGQFDQYCRSLAGKTVIHTSDIKRLAGYRTDLADTLTDDQKWEMKVKQLAKLAKR